jgi:hypothetical protein
MARFLFRGRSPDPTAQDASRRITGWARRILQLDEAATVSVSEIACGDPACGGAETVVLVMRPSRRTEAAKVKMPMALVTEQILREALAVRAS